MGLQTMLLFEIFVYDYLDNLPYEWLYTFLETFDYGEPEVFAVESRRSDNIPSLSLCSCSTHQLCANAEFVPQAQATRPKRLYKTR